MDEYVIGYINKGMNLSLNCKDKLTKALTIKMCTQGMHYNLCYILQGIKWRTFEELAMQAHNMELIISGNRNMGSPSHDPWKGKDKQDAHKWGKYSLKTSNKDAMTHYSSKTPK